MHGTANHTLAVLGVMNTVAMNESIFDAAFTPLGRALSL